jgi:hypothetical protein
MNSYKKDFENALEMIEWQNTMLRQQAEKIEALKNAKRFIQNFAEEQHRRACKLEETQEVMAEHCTCYKLGYSQLNDYRKVENENNNEAA